MLFTADPRTLWLGLFAIIGIHFLLFVPVHGRIAGILDAVLIANATAGFLLPCVALPDFFIVDGSLKLLAGVPYLRLAPSTEEQTLSNGRPTHWPMVTSRFHEKRGSWTGLDRYQKLDHSMLF